MQLVIMRLFSNWFGKKKEVDFDSLGMALSESGKDSLIKFTERSKDERLGDVMLLGDQGNHEYFYILYYAILFDEDENVRFAGLKRLHKFKTHSLFNSLLEKIEEGPTDELEPYYSMMLSNTGVISEDEFRERADN